MIKLHKEYDFSTCEFNCYLNIAGLTYSKKTIRAITLHNFAYKVTLLAGDNVKILLANGDQLIVNFEKGLMNYNVSNEIPL